MNAEENISGNQRDQREKKQYVIILVMKNKISEPDITRLTSRMDVGTKEFHDFQAFLLKKTSPTV